MISHFLKIIAIKKLLLAPRMDPSGEAFSQVVGIWTPQPGEGFVVVQVCNGVETQLDDLLAEGHHCVVESVPLLEDDLRPEA